MRLCQVRRECANTVFSGLTMKNGDFSNCHHCSNMSKNSWLFFVSQQSADVSQNSSSHIPTSFFGSVSLSSSDCTQIHILASYLLGMLRGHGGRLKESAFESEGHRLQPRFYQRSIFCFGLVFIKSVDVKRPPSGVVGICKTRLRCRSRCLSMIWNYYNFVPK
ncbi:hypothetical protein AVEN_221756-1 [Araneus ventricosus]|uniref:Uncharacterized protein n=1 Tax=Araneus ventricosus TaxID=182803 RepID=A0A4Y2FN99_ARAVE|nr:hypothetical protein AVEN_221756-1 [Araneus ventricosus]